MGYQPPYDLVTTNGCFDSIPLHAGHMFFLGFCKACAKKLIIGLNSDEHIRHYKRPNPIPVEIRKQALLELGFIDEIVIFDEPDPINFIKLVKPNAHCVGAEYQGDLCVERRYCVENGIVIVEIPRVGKWSSSNERGRY